MALILAPNTEVPAADRVTAPDLLVMHKQLRVGRIRRREAAINRASQWIWAITGVRDGPEAMRLSGTAATIEEAQAALQENWERWLAWAGLSELG
jgi:hypothetical protein